MGALPPLFLAPMAEFTSPPMRVLCEERGAALDALEERAAGLVANLDTEGTQALTEAMRLLADELANATPLEEQERDPNEAVARDERSPAAIIRDALRRQAGDLVDSLETRRETLV